MCHIISLWIDLYGYVVINVIWHGNSFADKWIIDRSNCFIWIFNYSLFSILKIYFEKCIVYLFYRIRFHSFIDGKIHWFHLSQIIAVAHKNRRENFDIDNRMLTNDEKKINSLFASFKKWEKEINSHVMIRVETIYEIQHYSIHNFNYTDWNEIRLKDILIKNKTTIKTVFFFPFWRTEIYVRKKGSKSHQPRTLQCEIHLLNVAKNP